MSAVAAILIAGPTASGKSALALRVAREIGGAVVNADSMQVYRDLAILSNRPSVDEITACPHHLFGHVDAAVNHSVGLYAREAAAILAGLERERVLPIVVGGTGLYLKALTEGLSDLPPVPDAVRDAVRRAAEGVPTPDLHVQLAARDPASAAVIRPSDRQRILRALEMHAATGRSIAGMRGSREPGPLSAKPIVAVFLAPDRDVLRARIDRRFEAMVAAGALGEVAALAARVLDPALPVMRAHGVPGLLAHLGGGIGLDEAIRRGQADTRAYAKRQFTWFRHQMPGFEAVAPEEAYDVAMRGLSARRAG